VTLEDVYRCGCRKGTRATLAAIGSVLTVRQDKTKAKQRYLKAKKERRKRKKVKPSASTKAAETGEEGGAEEAAGSEVEAENAEEIVEVHSPSESPEKETKEERKERRRMQKEERKRVRARKDADADVDADADAEQAVDVTARPRKRRKLDVAKDDHIVSRASSRASTPHVLDAITDTHAHADADADEPRAHTPELPSLPSFPQPRQPPAPPRAQLASQGLDRALARAQLVDPALSSPISFDTQDDTSGLSTKTRTRLKELGITELFAGLFYRARATLLRRAHC
jgi:ATP-dependent RNA helicase DDX51/DBP6